MLTLSHARMVPDTRRFGFCFPLRRNQTGIISPTRRANVLKVPSRDNSQLHFHTGSRATFFQWVMQRRWCQAWQVGSPRAELIGYLCASRPLVRIVLHSTASTRSPEKGYWCCRSPLCPVLNCWDEARHYTSRQPASVASTYVLIIPIYWTVHWSARFLSFKALWGWHDS